MKKLVLSKAESEALKKNGFVEISRNGFDITIEPNYYYNPDVEEDFCNQRYMITIINCFEKVILK